MKSKYVQHPKGIEINLSNRGIIATFALAATATFGSLGLTAAGSYTVGKAATAAVATEEISTLRETGTAIISEAAEKNRELSFQNQACIIELQGKESVIDAAKFAAMEQAKLTEAQRRHIVTLETIIEAQKTGIAPPPPVPEAPRLPPIPGPSLKPGHLLKL